MAMLFKDDDNLCATGLVMCATPMLLVTMMESFINRSQYAGSQMIPLSLLIRMAMVLVIMLTLMTMMTRMIDDADDELSY